MHPQFAQESYAFFSGTSIHRCAMFGGDVKLPEGTILDKTLLVGGLNPSEKY